MSPDSSLIEIVQLTLVITIKIAAPILAAGLVVGLIISIFQAVTSMQEQTITFVPKIVAMIAVTVLLIPWIFAKLMEFSVEMFTNF